MHLLTFAHAKIGPDHEDKLAFLAVAGKGCELADLLQQRISTCGIRFVAQVGFLILLWMPDTVAMCP
jgi:hypothetical protein